MLASNANRSGQIVGYTATAPRAALALLPIMAAHTMSMDSDLADDDWAEVLPLLTPQLHRARAQSSDLHTSSPSSPSAPSVAPVKSLPSCPDCGSKMTTRINKSDKGWFLGCSRHPECLGVLPHPSGRFPVQSHAAAASSQTASFPASAPPTPNDSNEKAKPQRRGFLCTSCNGFNTFTGGNGTTAWKKCKDCGHGWDKQSTAWKRERAIKTAANVVETVNMVETVNVVEWHWYRMVLWAFKLLQKAEIREADRRFLGMNAWRRRVEAAAEAAFQA